MRESQEVRKERQAGVTQGHTKELFYITTVKHNGGFLAQLISENRNLDSTDLPSRGLWIGFRGSMNLDGKTIVLLFTIL